MPVQDGKTLDELMDQFEDHSMEVRDAAQAEFRRRIRAGDIEAYGRMLAAIGSMDCETRGRANQIINEENEAEANRHRAEAEQLDNQNVPQPGDRWAPGEAQVREAEADRWRTRAKAEPDRARREEAERRADEADRDAQESRNDAAEARRDERRARGGVSEVDGKKKRTTRETERSKRADEREDRARKRNAPLPAPQPQQPQQVQPPEDKAPQK
jgi:hypothetical protein